ncbi:MAG: multidrug ABC transporter permease [Burkholderiales bacterium]|nr:multidrug ABC transporter permease [Nitrosomonas sp.]MCP5274639.1 multidrug ABC transporter permease [Burkholderiales bacterium]
MKQVLKMISVLSISGIVWFVVQTILLITTDLTGWVSLTVSLICAAWAGWCSWKLFSGEKIRVSAAILAGALIFGALGFLFGFFGPLLIAKDTQQATFVGIFVASPLGLALGALGGYIYASRQGG